MWVKATKLTSCVAVVCHTSLAKMTSVRNHNSKPKCTTSLQESLNLIALESYKS